MFAQLLAHLVGDYSLQSDWMAQRKTKDRWAAFAHALVYTACFAPVAYLAGASPVALAVIGLTHFLIDHYRLARYVCWAKNFLAPPTTLYVDYVHVVTTAAGRELHDPQVKVLRWWHPWSKCSGTGYHEDTPVWLATWLLIITDNTMHLLINFLALRYL